MSKIGDIIVWDDNKKYHEYPRNNIVKYKGHYYKNKWYYRSS